MSHHCRRGYPCLRAALGNPFQFIAEVLCGMPSIVRFLGQTFLYPAIQCRRRHRLKGRDGRRVVLQNCPDHTRLAVALERFLPGRHFVDDCAKRKDIGPSIDFSAFDLLRSHVLQRPDSIPPALSTARSQWAAAKAEHSPEQLLVSTWLTRSPAAACIDGESLWIARGYDGDLGRWEGGTRTRPCSWPRRFRV